MPTVFQTAGAGQLWIVCCRTSESRTVTAGLHRKLRESDTVHMTLGLSSDESFIHLGNEIQDSNDSGQRDLMTSAKHGIDKGKRRVRLKC